MNGIHVDERGDLRFGIPVIPQEMGTTNPTNLTNQDAARPISVYSVYSVVHILLFIRRIR